MRPHRARRSAFAALVALPCSSLSRAATQAPRRARAAHPRRPHPRRPPHRQRPPIPRRHVRTLQHSSRLENLTKVKPAEDGVTALTTAIAGVKTSLDKAEASASPVLQPACSR
jgi:hypothetical protein